MGTVNVEVKLKTDSYPLEPRWTLTNKCGSGTVINGPVYSSPNYMHSNMYCLPNGSYDFRITDSYGDGICCNYGMGSYEVIMAGVSAVIGGAFLSEETKTFGSCALAPTQRPTTATPTALPTPPPTPCPNGGINVEVKLKTDNWYQETAWTLTNKCGSGTVINSPVYTSSGTMFVNQYCVPVGSYDFRITDSYGDGICCTWGLGSYEVIMGGVSAATGGQFTREETKTFGACAELPVTTEPSSSQATSNPSHHPTPILTEPPTSSAPTNQPTSQPTSNPTSSAPTSQPTSNPTSSAPTNQPTSNPTSSAPTSQPTSNPTSSAPTSQPTSNPTSSAPTSQPTSNPTSLSSTSPPTSNPTSLSPTSPPTTSKPTSPPTSNPTSLPPVNAGPPTRKPTLRPTTRKPTRKPVTRTPTRTPTRAPTQPPGSICIGGTFIEIRILTDTYPTETAWTLTNLCGTGTSLSSPFYTAKSTEHSTINCLPNGLYNFTITDSANDGLCCAYGIGNYSVVVNGTVAYTGSNFGAKETQMIGACV
ncbi:hypothetical protein ACHAWU_000306 [Discostella pseudostelligera]|uniref:Uncharacterized protein n=1 Tax=Discostella pseudostelligera TaxID=259834 RepID=A0ABD3MUI6_9STRA